VSINFVDQANALTTTLRRCLIVRRIVSVTVI